MADGEGSAETRSSLFRIFGKKDSQKRISRSKSDDRVAEKKRPSFESRDEDADSTGSNRNSIMSEAIGIDLCDGHGVHTAVRDASNRIISDIVPELFSANVYIPALNKSVQLRLQTQAKIKDAMDAVMESLGDAASNLQGDFGLFLRGKDDTLRYLTEMRTPQSYGMLETASLVFKAKTPEDRSVRVVLPREEIVSQLHHDQYTSVADALAEIKEANGITDRQYGLYSTAGGEWMDEKELLSTYNLCATDTVECKERPRDDKDAGRMVLAVHIPSVNVTLKMYGQRTMTVAEVITTLHKKELLKKLSTRDTSQFGLVLLPNGRGGKRARPIWMEDYKFLASFNMAHEEKLEYRAKFEPFRVDASPRSLGSAWLRRDDVEAYNVDADEQGTIRDMLELSCAALSLPDVYDYALHFHDDTLVPTTVVDSADDAPGSSSGGAYSVATERGLPAGMQAGQMGTLQRQTTNVSTLSSGFSSISSATGALAAALAAQGGIMRENFVSQVYQKNKDTFVLKPLKRKVQVTVDGLEAVKRKHEKEVDIDDMTAFSIDFFEPFEALVDLVRRRYGFRPEEKPTIYFLDDSGPGNAVDPKKSPVELCVQDGQKFVIFDNHDACSKALERRKRAHLDRTDSALCDEDYDVNIWDEGPDNESNIVFEKETDADGHRPVLAASFNKLVERMTDGKAVDVKFVKTFVLTYQSFTTPEKLLDKLTERYNGVRQAGTKLVDFYSQQRNIQIRVYNAMKMWLEMSPELEGNDALCETFFRFIRRTLLTEHPKLAKQLRTYCIKAKEGKLNRNRGHTHDESAPAPIPPKRDPNPNSKPSMWDYDPQEIARQMTLIDFKKFQAIKPAELLNQAWNKEKYHHKAPNVMGLIKRINELGLWTATNILLQKDVKARAKRFTDFIQIASHLYAMNNFSTLMAILGGLNHSAILRLKHTKKEMDKKVLKKLEELEAVMTPEGNYRNFREAIHNVNPPCIPYLCVVTSDLTFLDDGNPNFMNELINFAKRRLVFEIIADMMTYQDKPYNFIPIKEILDQIYQVEAISDKLLYDISLQKEPRGT